MYQYKAIKEIERDLINRSYIKAAKDINLHLNSRFDQYSLNFDDELQEADVKRRIIREVINHRKEAELRKNLKLNKNTDINTKKKATKKRNLNAAKKVFAIDFISGKGSLFKSYKEAAKKLQINYSNLIQHLKSEKFYMKRRKIMLFRCGKGENTLLLENRDEIVRIAIEIYEEENKSKYADPLSPLEALDLAMQIMEERLKNENR